MRAGGSAGRYHPLHLVMPSPSFTVDSRMGTGPESGQLSQRHSFLSPSFRLKRKSRTYSRWCCSDGRWEPGAPSTGLGPHEDNVREGGALPEPRGGGVPPSLAALQPPAEEATLGLSDYGNVLQRLSGLSVPRHRESP